MPPTSTRHGIYASEADGGLGGKSLAEELALKGPARELHVALYSGHLEGELTRGCWNYWKTHYTDIPSLPRVPRIVAITWELARHGTYVSDLHNSRVEQVSRFPTAF